MKTSHQKPQLLLALWAKGHPMKSAFCTNVFGTTQKDMEQAIPRLTEMGYDGLEFWEQYLSGADLGWPWTHTI